MRVLLIGVLLVLGFPGLLLHADEPEVVYIEDEPEYDTPANEGDAEDASDWHFDVQLPRWYAPHVGTPDWMLADYGLRFRLRRKNHNWFEYADVEYAFSNLGFEQSPGYGNYANLETGLRADHFTHIQLGVRGLLAEPAANGYLETVANLGWLQQDTGMPWNGLYAAGDLVLGTNWKQAWAIGRTALQYNHHLVADTWLLSASAGGLLSSGDTVPRLRRAKLRNGFVFLPDDLGTGTYTAERAVRMGASYQAKIKFTPILGELQDEESDSLDLRGMLAAGVWGAHGEQGFSGSASQPYAEAGLVFLAGLVMDETQKRTDEQDTRELSPLAALEVTVPLTDSSDSWRISLLIPIDPSDIIRW